MIQDIHLLYGALLLTAVMVWEFFTLAFAVGAFKHVGRRPLGTRPFLALSVAALMPGICFLGSLASAEPFLGTTQFWLPAVAMATIGALGRLAMGALRVWGSQEEE